MSCRKLTSLKTSLSLRFSSRASPVFVIFLFIFLFSMFVYVPEVKGDLSWKQVYPSHDSYVKISANTTNYGSEGYLTLGNHPVSGWLRTWVQFDLSEIPNTYSISSITLNALCCGRSLEPPTVKVYRSTDDSWTESTITWNNQPEYNDTLIDEQVIEGLQWITFDVNSAVQTEFSGDKIVSFCLLGTEEEKFCTFYSKDDPYETNWIHLLFLTDDNEEGSAGESGNGEPTTVIDIPEITVPQFHIPIWGYYLILGSIGIVVFASILSKPRRSRHGPNGVKVTKTTRRYPKRNKKGRFT